MLKLFYSYIHAKRKNIARFQNFFRWQAKTRHEPHRCDPCRNQNEPNNAKGRIVLKHNLEAPSNELQQAIRGGSIEQSTMDYSKKM
jgi:hypothetical protein